MQTVTSESLKAIEALKDVPENQLQWLIDNSSHYIVPDGGYITETGKPITGTFIIIEGKFRMYVIQQKGLREIALIETNAITGYLPFSRGLIANVTSVAIGESQVMNFPKERINELIRTHFELTQALVHVMSSRVRDYTALVQQNEKMMALGKLSAGLAHELNNPAAAIVRDAASLKKHLQLLPESFKDVMAIRMTNAQTDKVNGKMFEVLGRTERPVLTLMQRSAKEEELEDWLEGNNVANALEIAENFVDYGFTLSDLEEFQTIIPGQHLTAWFKWMNDNLVTDKMVNDIEEASKRISLLVNSVRNFTHMDRDFDKQETDIHSGIRNTITMLGYKIRKGNIEVVEDYDLSLPNVRVMVGELNQVWTNLIDNALDAMEVNKKGILKIKTEREKESVKVSIVDNGPGIPDEIKSRIFDPFFTTKDIGKGTGLGLDVVARIVRQHRGSIKVDAEPGRTAFIVCFPIEA